MPPTVTDQQAAARARAAMGYAGLTYKVLEEESGVSYDTLRALMSRSNAHGATSDRLDAIADACSVPRRFMEEGFDPLEEGEADADLRVRLRRVERLLEELARGDQRQRVGRRQEPPGALGRTAAQGSQPTPRRKTDTESQQAQDKRRDVG